MFRLLLPFFLLMLGACKSTRQEAGIPSLPKMEVDYAANPEILMVLFYINQNDSVAISESYSNYGVYRGKDEVPNVAYEGDLRVTFLGSTGIVCQQKMVANPLLKKAEYASDDGSGRIMAQAVDLAEASFFVRLQWQDCIQQCLVEKFDDGNWKKLKLLPLSKPDIR
jgi:hypothetical protein